MPGLEVWCKTLFVFIHMYIIQSEKNNNNISLFCVVTYECVEENIHAKLGGVVFTEATKYLLFGLLLLQGMWRQSTFFIQKN